MMRLLISGGPGSGCTSTASAIGEHLGIPVFDSDSYFHKPTDPPFQEPYAPEERRTMLGSALAGESNWVLSGSVATWGVDLLHPTHGVFLDMPKAVRLDRLMHRQTNRFGSRIDSGGDMQEEHEAFMAWAAEYEDRVDVGRNSKTDRAFLEAHCKHFMVLTEAARLEEIVAKILAFLAETGL